MNKKTHLRYTLKPLRDNKFAFQILDQSKEVTSFLKDRNFHDSGTGFTVSKATYPEIYDSMNIITLRGSDPTEDNKVDVTRTVGAVQRENRMNLVHTTLKNFVKTVKKGDYDNLKQRGVYVLG